MNEALLLYIKNTVFGYTNGFCNTIDDINLFPIHYIINY